MLRLIGFYDYTVILTYASLFSALLGMTLSAQGRFTAAILCLMFSGLCDAFDGIVARTKKGRTDDEKRFGIQIDSLCDVVSFGVAPAVLCYHMGVRGIWGFACGFLFVLCGVIRLAFFNVLEEKRQHTEGGSNKTYRGLPITTSSMILPPVYLLRFVLGPQAFVIVLHVFLAVCAILFVLDVSVKKINWLKLLRLEK